MSDIRQIAQQKCIDSDRSVVSKGAGPKLGLGVCRFLIYIFFLPCIPRDLKLHG